MALLRSNDSWTWTLLCGATSWQRTVQRACSMPIARIITNCQPFFNITIYLYIFSISIFIYTHRKVMSARASQGQTPFMFINNSIAFPPSLIYSKMSLRMCVCVSATTTTKKPFLLLSIDNDGLFTIWKASRRNRPRSSMLSSISIYYITRII